MDFKCNACGATFHMAPGFQGHQASCTKCHKGVLLPAFHHAGDAPAAAAGPKHMEKVPHAVHRPRPHIEEKPAKAQHGKVVFFLKKIFGGKGAPAETQAGESHAAESEVRAVSD